METQTAPSPRIFDSYFAVVAIVLVASGLFLVGRLAWADGHPSALADVGRKYTKPGPLPEGLVVRRNVGFDGQFYYRLALNPFTTSKTEFGLTLDQPARRQQRILYPLMAWILSGGGQARAVPWALIAINLLSYAAIALLGTKLVREVGRSPPTALLFAAAPGLLIALGFDTSEILAVSLMLGTLLTLRAARFGWSTLLLTLALLTRETTLVIAIGLLIPMSLGFRNKVPYEIRGQRVPFATSLVPIALYIAWQGFLWARWGKPAFTSTDGSDLGFPLVGLVHAVRDWLQRGQAADNAFFLAVIIGVIVLGVVTFRTTLALPHERAAFAVAALLACFFQWTILIHYATFLRGLGEVYVLGILMYLAGPRRNVLPIGVAGIGVWGYLFVQARVIG